MIINNQRVKIAGAEFIGEVAEGIGFVSLD